MIAASPVKISSGHINVGDVRARDRQWHREGARVSKQVQHPLEASVRKRAPVIAMFEE